MSVNKMIADVLKPFGDPVCFLEYIPEEGKKAKNKYYTFNYTKIGADFGDDTPGHERFLIQVHYFCPAAHNCLKQVQATQDALFKAGFIWPEVMYTNDSSGQHVIFETEIALGINKQES